MNDPMTPTDIRKRLLDLDLPQTQLARELGVTPAMINCVIRGRRPTTWVRRFVADKLGMEYREVWGEEDPGTTRGRYAPRRPVAVSLHTSSNITGGAPSTGAAPKAPSTQEAP